MILREWSLGPAIDIQIYPHQHGANLTHHQTKGNFKLCSGYLVYLPSQVTVCAVCRHTHTRSRDTQARLVAVG